MNILDKVRHKDTTYLTNNIKDNQSAETLGEALKKDEEDIDNLQTTTQTSTVNKKSSYRIIFILYDCSCNRIYF